MGKHFHEELVDAQLDTAPGSARVGRSPLRALYEWLVLVGGFLYIAAYGLTLTLASLVLGRILSRTAQRPLGRRIIHNMFRGLTAYMRASGIVRLDLSALDTLADAEPLVLAPNHPSLLDATLVVSRLVNVVCVMKADVHRNPVLGGGARLAGYIDNATMPRMIRGAAAALGEGRMVLMFPEGTRTVSAPINPLKASFALVAKQARVPVQTILFETNSPFLSKGWPIFKRPQFQLVYRARLGRRFVVDGDPRATVAEIDAYFRRELAAPGRNRI